MVQLDAFERYAMWGDDFAVQCCDNKSICRADMTLNELIPENILLINQIFTFVPKFMLRNLQTMHQLHITFFQVLYLKFKLMCREIIIYSYFIDLFFVEIPLLILQVLLICLLNFTHCSRYNGRLNIPVATVLGNILSNPGEIDDIGLFSMPKKMLLMMNL